jgi:hypothetical protein
MHPQEHRYSQQRHTEEIETVSLTRAVNNGKYSQDVVLTAALVNKISE